MIQVDGGAGDTVQLGDVGIEGGGLTVAANGLLQTSGNVTLTDTSVTNDGTIEVTGGKLTITGSGSVADSAANDGGNDPDRRRRGARPQCIGHPERFVRRRRRRAADRYRQLRRHHRRPRCERPDRSQHDRLRAGHHRDLCQQCRPYRRHPDGHRRQRFDRSASGRRLQQRAFRRLGRQKRRLADHAARQ